MRDIVSRIERDHRKIIGIPDVLEQIAPDPSAPGVLRTVGGASAAGAPARDILMRRGR